MDVAATIAAPPPLLTRVAETNTVADVQLTVSNAACKKVGKKLPGPLAIAVCGRTLAQVVANPQAYWVCEKSDGERAMLAAMARGVFMVNRSFVVSKLAGGEVLLPALLKPQHAAAAAAATVLDGELVQDLSTTPPRDVFLVFDILCLDGVSFVKQPLLVRLRAIGELIRRVRGLGSAADACRLALVPKEFQPACHITRIFNNIHKARDGHHRYMYKGKHVHNANDGIIFTPGEQGYWTSLLKWKWAQHNTVDFKVDYAGIVGATLVHGTGGAGAMTTVPLMTWTQASSHVAVAQLLLTKAEFNVLSAAVSGAGFAIVECAYSRETSRWHLKCLRPDKSTANHVSVAFQTMEVLVENISAERLVRELGGKKQAAAAAAAAAGSGSSSSSNSSNTTMK